MVANRVVGEVAGRVCVLVDDMIDTGGTITKAADALMADGAKGVIIAATHAILSGPAVERLRDCAGARGHRHEHPADLAGRRVRRADRPVHRAAHQRRGQGGLRGRLGDQPVRGTRLTRREQLGLLAAIASAAAFATSGPFAKSLLAIGWTPGPSSSSGSAAPPSLAPAVHAGRRSPGDGGRSAPPCRRSRSYGALAVAGAQLCYFQAIERLTVGVALLLEYLGIVLVVLVVWARTRRPPGRVTLAGIAVGGGRAGPRPRHRRAPGPRPRRGRVGPRRRGGPGDATTSSPPRSPTCRPSPSPGLGLGVGAVILAVLGTRRDPAHGVCRGLASTLAGPLPCRRGWPSPSWPSSPRPRPTSSGSSAARALGSTVASFVGLTEVLFAILFAWVLLGELPRLGPARSAGCSSSPASSRSGPTRPAATGSRHATRCEPLPGPGFPRPASRSPRIRGLPRRGTPHRPGMSGRSPSVIDAVVAAGPPGGPRETGARSPASHLPSVPRPASRPTAPGSPPRGARPDASSRSTAVSVTTLVAEPRTQFGKGAARKIRRDHQIPAVMYGHGTRPDPHHPSGPRRHAGPEEPQRPADDRPRRRRSSSPSPRTSSATRSSRSSSTSTSSSSGAARRSSVEVSVHVEGEAGPETVVSLDHTTITLEAEATNIPDHIVVSVEGLPAGTQIHAGRPDHARGLHPRHRPRCARRQHPAADLRGGPRGRPRRGRGGRRGSRSASAAEGPRRRVGPRPRPESRTRSPVRPGPEWGRATPVGGLGGILARV